MNKKLLFAMLLAWIPVFVYAQDKLEVTNVYERDSTIFYLETCSFPDSFLVRTANTNSLSAADCNRYANAFAAVSAGDTFMVTARHALAISRAAEYLFLGVDGIAWRHHGAKVQPYQVVDSIINSGFGKMICYKISDYGPILNRVTVTGTIIYAEFSQAEQDNFFGLGKRPVNEEMDRLYLIEVSPDTYHSLKTGGFSGAPILTPDGKVCGVAVGVTHFYPTFIRKEFAGRYFIRASVVQK